MKHVVINIIAPVYHAYPMLNSYFHLNLDRMTRSPFTLNQGQLDHHSEWLRQKSSMPLLSVSISLFPEPGPGYRYRTVSLGYGMQSEEEYLGAGAGATVKFQLIFIYLQNTAHSDRIQTNSMLYII